MTAEIAYAEIRNRRDWRNWLEKNHASSSGIWVVFFKDHTGVKSLSYQESLDEALCFGWIDGLRKSLGKDAYAIRFSPRRTDSIWSNVNTRRIAELMAAGRVRAAGHAAFKRRDPKRSGIYAMEARSAAFDAPTGKAFRRHRAAWKFFTAQPPGYRRIVTHWVMSAKRDETRRKRLDELVAVSARGERVAFMTKYARPQGGR